MPHDDDPAADVSPRRTLPHGDVSPDGLRPWPHPSARTRWLVWGGTALASAALTVGAALAARKAARLLSSDQRPGVARPPGPGLMQEIEANTASIAHGVDDAMLALDMAVSGFRAVAAETGGILREFNDSADLLRGFSRRAATPAGRHDPTPMPDLKDDPLQHDPLTGPAPSGPADHDPRLHRL